MSMPLFSTFRKNPYDGLLVTIDPGETTGYSVWINGKLKEAGQLETKTVKDSVQLLKDFTNMFLSKADQKGLKTYFVIEEYRVYSFKTADHAHDDMHTSRLIGCFECLLTMKDIGYEMRGASHAKKWADDKKLKAWNFWVTRERHARDAIRHGIFFYHHRPDPFQKDS